MHADYFRDARPLREMGAPALRSALRDATRRGAARGRDRHIVNSRLLLLLLLLNPTIDAATNSPRRSHLIVSDAYGTRNIPLLFRSAPPFTGSVPVRFAFESTRRDSTRLDFISRICPGDPSVSTRFVAPSGTFCTVSYGSTAIINDIIND